MNLLTGIIARIFFAVPFLGLGINHFLNASFLAGIVPIPGGVIWVYLTGIAMILAGIAAITKYQGKLAMLLLALLLFIYIISIHVPSVLNPDTRMLGLMGLYKDFGLMGGALLLAGIFNNESKQKEQV